MALEQRRLGLLNDIGRYSDLGVVAGVVLILVMMVVPLPTWLVDVLLAVNISLALLILMLTMNVQHPLQFSIFPALLLIMTLFRLALNVSTTRLILLKANAGSLIQAFGDFVVGGNYVVGFVVFLILIVIQFIVITKGAERVAEVAARFTLDAMPGKQMSIDADLNSGLLTEAEARQRRRDVEREADFYGAMDGASKFVKGDAIAGIVITLINILGGFAIGMGQMGMPFADAVRRYTLLTVGDGLVTQIPALLISTATGIIITRAASELNMGSDLTQQLLAEPKVLAVAAIVLLAFGLIPGLPFPPFFVISLIVGALALSGTRKQQRELAAQEEVAEPVADTGPESVLSLLHVDPMELEIGYGLIPLVDAEQGGDMLERITLLRRQMALELGIVVPSIRIRDNMELPRDEYVVRIKGVEVGRGQLMPSHYLAMDAAGNGTIAGIETREPAFNLPALWIDPSARADAERAGYTVVDASAVLTTHLTEIIRRHAPDLLGRQETKMLLDKVREDYSAVVDELVPDLLTVGEVQRVLQNLLSESIPIRNLVVILEVLADGARQQRDVEELTELVRAALAPQLTQLFGAADGTLSVLTLDASLEEELREAIGEEGHGLGWDPRRVQLFLDRVAKAWESAMAKGMQPVLLCPPPLRRALRQLTMRALPRLPVMSYNEVAPSAEVQAAGMVTLNDAD